MESTLSFSTTPLPTSFNSSIHQKPIFQLKASAVTCTSSLLSLNSKLVKTGSVGDAQICRSGYHSSFCYDKPIPEEIIEKPVAMLEKSIGNNPRCSSCEAKGATPCATCSGSGLYIDSIMECQGIIVKVRCLGCGGTGNIMCSQCGGWGHI